MEGFRGGGGESGLSYLRKRLHGRGGGVGRLPRSHQWGQTPDENPCPAVQHRHATTSTGSIRSRVEERIRAWWRREEVEGVSGGAAWNKSWGRAGKRCASLSRVRQSGRDWGLNLDWEACGIFTHTQTHTQRGGAEGGATERPAPHAVFFFFNHPLELHKRIKSVKLADS